jgi:regulator of cell morphogenesis and NO signaling
LAKQRNTETEITYKIGSLEEPINLLKKDHEIAAIDLSYFKKLTDDYRLPADACSSYQYFFRKLMEFENNLKIHLELENDILFPKAILLDAELAQLN